MIRRAVITAALAALALPAAAEASTWQLSHTGDPLLARTQWWHELWACPPGDVCRWIANEPRHEPGETAPGTVFESQLGNGTMERSPAWRGRVAATAGAALEGSATPGGRVRPVPATWTGGWGDERSVSAVLVCRSRTRQNCEVLNGKVPRDGYLFAVEHRLSRDEAAPGDLTRPQPSARVSLSAPVPVAAEPPDATVELRRRALGRVVGTVTCARRCSVVVTAGGERRSFAARGTRRITLTRSTGRPLVRVTVDGVPLASARVWL
jgi:hypothetical protein